MFCHPFGLSMNAADALGSSMGFLPDQQVTPAFNFFGAHRLMALELTP
jgi:hypothetical protein